MFLNLSAYYKILHCKLGIEPVSPALLLKFTPSKGFNSL